MEEDIVNDEEYTLEELREAAGHLKAMLLKEKLKNDVLMLALARLGGELTFSMGEVEEIQNYHLHCVDIGHNKIKMTLELDNTCENDKTKH